MRIAIVLILIFTFSALRSYANTEDRIQQKTPEYEPQRENSQETPEATDSGVFVFRGTASYYGQSYCEQFNPGCKTASGELFDETLYTCACPSHIPLGSVLLVSSGGRSLEVRCNDRGGFGKHGRVLDLSKASFEYFASTSSGIIPVEFEVMGR